MTWGFLYLLLFMGGATLALVTGVIRRLLHPTLLFDGVVAPSAEHWASQHSPLFDVAVSFVTLFGLVTLVLHGVTTLDVVQEIAIGAAGGAVGLFLIRSLLGRIHDPIHQVEAYPDAATVVREIPGSGFGQVEVVVGGMQLKLAAKSASGKAIPSGTKVRILDRRESVVVVTPAAD